MKPQRAQHVLAAVADDHDLGDVDPVLAQALRQPRPVAVGDDPRQHLGAGDEDARGLTCRSAGAPRTARAGACRAARRSRPGSSGRGRRSCACPPSAAPGRCRTRRGSACRGSAWSCAPACRSWLLISVLPLASTRQTLTIPVGTIWRVTRVGRRGLLLLGLALGAAWPSASSRRRSAPPPSSSPQLPERVERAEDQHEHEHDREPRAEPRAAARGARSRRPPGPRANGVSSIVDGRSKRCLYSSTSCRESSPR